MRSAKSIRKSYIIGDWCKNIFRYCQTRFVILCIIYIIAIILGFIIVGQFGSNLSEDNILDTRLLIFLQGDCNCLVLFLHYLLILCPLMCYAIFLNRNTFLVIINICIVVAIGYMFSYHIVIFFNIFSIIGFIVYILIVGAFSLAIMLCYLLLIATAWTRMAELKRFGKVCNCEQENIIKTIYIITFIISVILLLVYCIFLNLLRIVVCL